MKPAFLSRRKALQDLVQLRTSIAGAVANVAAYPWDSNEELVTFTRSDLRHALDEYEAGRLDDDELCAWAEALAGRDDVGMTSEDAERLIEILFELSTPGLFGGIAVVVKEANDWLASPELPVTPPVGCLGQPWGGRPE